MTSPRSSEISAGGVVVARVNDLFYVALVQRHDGGWVLPKGHLEAGESLEEGAIREIHEETGLSSEALKVVRYLRDFSFKEYAEDSTADKKNHFFLLFYRGPELKNLTTDQAHRAAKWHPLPLKNVKLTYHYQLQLLNEVVRELSADGRK